MSEREVTFGQKLSIATTLMGFGGTIVAVTLAWAKVDTRQTLTESRVTAVERLQESGNTRARDDRDILVELKTDMKQVKASVQRLEGRTTP